jgi:hypothetical protein
MRSQLMYVELKTGYNDNGPAWIGKAFFSKTGRSLYFNGLAFKKGSGIHGNYFEITSGDEYWISGVKKDGSDRHRNGTGKVNIDKAIISEYLSTIGKTELQKGKFTPIDVDNNLPKQQMNEMENREL